MLCANLADPAPAGAARGRSLAIAGTTGMSAGHGPPPVAHSCGATPVAAPGLSVGHGPLRAARGRGLATTAVPGLSAGHGLLRAARSCGGHAIQIVPLAVNDRQHVPGGGVHSRRSVVHEELHHHRWLSGCSQGP